MEKLINGSAEYIEKESKRYALATYHRWWLTYTILFRLEGILSKRNLAASKLDELKIKANILKSFVAKKESTEEVVKETISREEAELWNDLVLVIH